MFVASHELVTALRKGLASPFEFVFLDHPTDPARFWTGVGDETFMGETFKGVGRLARLSRLVDTGELQSHATTISLSGVPLDMLVFADDDIKNRVVQIWRRWKDVEGRFFADFRLIFEAKMDFATSREDGERGTITITTRSPISDLQTISNVVWSNEQLQADFPGDTGLDRLSDLVDKEILGWNTT